MSKMPIFISDNVTEKIVTTMTRQETATTILCAMLRTKAATGMTKKQLVDNAITYADMLTRRLEQIPEDAQQRAENGRTYERIDWDEIERITNESEQQ